MTLVDRFLSHPEKVHFTFDHGNGHVREYPGTQLLAEAAGLALRLRELGVVPGDRVAVVVPTSEPLLRTIIATWFARAGIVVLPHRLAGTRSASSAERLGRMLAKVEPKVVVGYAEVEAAIRAALGPTQHYLAAENLHETGSAEADSTLRPLPEDLALLQFSSGSTREPRAVIVRHGQLDQNSGAVASRALGTYDDRVFSWLPIYHDLGFLSGISFPIILGVRATLVPTELFVADVHSAIQSICRSRATLTAMPAFALDLIAQSLERTPPSPSSSLECIRAFYVGAEPMFPKRISRFESIARNHGLATNAVQTCYGLAEAVIGVAVSCPGAHWKVAVDPRVSSGGEQCSNNIVQAGPAVDGIEIQIASSDRGTISQPGRGRIWIKGSSVTEGYWGESESPLRDGWLDTGDEGFMLDGQLYVCGRTKDTLIRGGVNYDAHEIEDAAAELIGQQLPALRCRVVAVFAVRDDVQQRERAVAVLDVKHPPDDRDAAFNMVRAGVLATTGLGLDDIAYARPPGLPRTTSGKLQRGAAREHYLAGDYA